MPAYLLLSARSSLNANLNLALNAIYFIWKPESWSTPEQNSVLQKSKRTDFLE